MSSWCRACWWSRRSRKAVCPEPAAHLSAFAADGLEFTLGYWVNDIEKGQLNLRSDVNKAILAALRLHGIDIPYPQRVVHQRP
jgi:small-conductance mechanosensitive channel